MTRTYPERTCIRCEGPFIPTGPAQKRCVVCAREVQNEHTAAYRSGHPDRVAEQGRRAARKYAGTRRGRLLTLLGAARARTKKNRLPACDLDLDFLASIAPEVCPVLGLALDYGRKGKCGATVNSPSLDRIKPPLGYVKGNVRVLSHRANQLLSDGTLEEHRLVVRFLEGV